MGLGFGYSCGIGELWVGGKEEQGGAQMRSNLEWGFSRGSGSAFRLMERLVKMVDRFWSVAGGEGIWSGSFSLVEGMVVMRSVVEGEGLSSTVVNLVGTGLGLLEASWAVPWFSNIVFWLISVLGPRITER